MIRKMYKLTMVTEQTLAEYKIVGGIDKCKKIYFNEWLTWFEVFKLKRRIKRGDYPNIGFFWIIEIKKDKL